MAKTHTAAKGTMGNSPLASLAGRATTQSATATRDDTRAINFSGQYLLGKFVTEKDETSKLDIIKAMIEQVDVQSLKQNLNDMVEMAAKIDIEAGIPENEVTKRGPTWRTAANNRTVIQKVYGALRFAPEELKSLGYHDDMGYHACSAIAKKALETKQIKWDASTAKSPEQRDTDKQFRAEAKALKDVQAEHPRQPNETLVQYQQRTLGMVAEKIEQMQQDAEFEAIQMAAATLLEKGHDYAKAVAEAVLAAIKELELV
jgi:hypothetical protein